MPPRKSNSKRVPVSSHKHKDKRVNIPTRELRGFVEQDEKAPKTVTYDGLLYARDPSLDPQLVWKGKDEQDQKPLEVPAVPVYIQEKINPQAIVEQVRAEARKETPGQAELFKDFNGIKFEEMVDFYHHKQNWSNRMILGDSLLVMTSLAEKEGLKGKVQMIYIDPPYGIKFGSNWQVSTRKRDVKDGKAEDVVRQPEQIRAFRDTWQYGIHSYLSYMRDRLIAARELLSETGSVFVQIGDENLHLVRCLMDETFGSENLCAVIPFQKTALVSSPEARTNVIGSLCDYILWYAKAIEDTKYRQLYLEKGVGVGAGAGYRGVLMPDGATRAITDAEAADPSCLPLDSRVYQATSLQSAGYSDKLSLPYQHQGTKFEPQANAHWKTHLDGLRRLGAAHRVAVSGRTLRYVRFVQDFPVSALGNLWSDLMGAQDLQYVVQTNTKVVERCLLMTTDPGDLVLDPTCGSGTTAYVAEQWGRRWITIDTSRVAIALARTRLMAAKFPYYLLADSPDGVGKEAEILGRVPLETKTDNDLRKGFVYQRVPHVTLKSIANNEDIDAIHAKWQEKLEPLRKELNTVLKHRWQEWEVPREADESWSAPAKKLHAEWWRLRRERQKEIDASIAAHADTELLYDKPYEDGKRIRVTGPFTVESMSPFRALAARDMTELSDNSDRVPSPAGQQDTTQFVRIILDNLRTAGVQNREKNERLKFDRLEPYAGTWLHASGEYTDAQGKSRKVAVSIGPEHGTVGPELVKEAAKEAVQGIGFDVLVVCGFAFDPHVSEEAKRYGKLTVLAARMNPDLSMGEELLKKTGAANLFMVFGEPDLTPLDPKSGKLLPQKDGKYSVEVRGVDVYDPTTGEIRSNTTDDIACWFIDTNYNDESFFVRHAYFCGGQEPYDRLKRALRAEVNEAAWSALYATKSLPFERPKTGKVAVKVINHYGDEVLKVLQVAK